jgi:hypothetical protein
MEDAPTVERERKTGDRRIALEELDPLRLEEPPRESRRRDDRDRDEDPSH